MVVHYNADNDELENEVRDVVKYFDELPSEEKQVLGKGFWPSGMSHLTHIAQVLFQTFHTGENNFIGSITWGVTRPPPPVVPPSAGGNPMHPVRLVTDRSTQHDPDNEGKCRMLLYKDQAAPIPLTEAPPLSDWQEPKQQCAWCHKWITQFRTICECGANPTTGEILIDLQARINLTCEHLAKVLNDYTVTKIVRRNKPEAVAKQTRGGISRDMKKPSVRARYAKGYLKQGTKIFAKQGCVTPDGKPLRVSVWASAWIWA